MTHVVVCSGDCEPETIPSVVAATSYMTEHLVAYPTHDPIEAVPLEEWRRRQRGPIGRLRVRVSEAISS